MQRGAKLLFVLGVPKSGTTWLQQLLDAHPDIRCTGEGALHWYLATMRDGVRNYNNHLSARGTIFQKQLFPPLAEAEFQRLARFFVAQRLQAAVGPIRDLKSVWLGNKDPDHGTNIDLMSQIFPNAAYIHVIRDGRDQLVSMWHHMRRHHPKFRPDHFADLDTMLREEGRKWTNYIRNVRKVAAEAELRYQEVRFEDLEADSHAALKNVLEFLAVDCSVGVIQECLNLTRFEVLSAGRSRGEEDENSFYRKGVSGDWCNYLSPKQSAEFCAVSGGLMTELGYEDPQSDTEV